MDSRIPSRKISPLNRTLRRFGMVPASWKPIWKSPGTARGRGGSVLELLQGHIGDDQAGAGIAFIVTFIVLVICPRLAGAPGEDEPILIVIVRRTQYNLTVCCLLAIHTPFSLPRRRMDSTGIKGDTV